MAITQSRLHEALNYNSETGVFTWKIKASRNTIIGEVAGRRHKKRGYIEISIDKTLYYAHRLAWLYVHGVWPVNDVDHINGDKGDNRIQNLRAATRGENGQNQAVLRNSVSGMLGAHWNKRSQNWSARIKIHGKMAHIGVFQSKEEAHVAYLMAKQMIHTFEPTPRG